MRNALISTALAIFACAHPLSAGTVSFDPPEVFIEPAVDLALIEFNVAIAPENGGNVQGMDVVLGSYHLTLTDFNYNPPWPCDFTVCDFVSPPGPVHIYPSDLFVWGFPPRDTSITRHLGYAHGRRNRIGTRNVQRDR